MYSEGASKSRAGWGARSAGKYAAELVVIGCAYFVLAKVGFLLASAHPSGTPMSAGTGLALAAIILRGLRVWPAIFVGALLANATTEIGNANSAASILTLSAIAAGNTLEALVGGYLVTLWSGGRSTFDTPNGVAKFALVGLGPGSIVSATVGVGSLCLAGYADWANFDAIWFTWWLGNVAGALVLTPVIVLWISGKIRPFSRPGLSDAILAYVMAAAIGLLAFNPLAAQIPHRSALSFLAILPLLWSALRCGPRHTATLALLLSCFAIWSTVSGGAPFAGATLNESFLLLIAFMISTAVPSLALSADVAVRTRVEASLLKQAQDLHAMFSRAVVGMAQADPIGRFTLVNDRFCEIVQRSPDELLRQRMQDLTDPDDLSHMRDLLDYAVRAGKSFIIENRYMLPDGSRVWIQNNVSVILDQDGTVRHLLAMAEDVTARRRAEEQLRRAHEDLERAVHERTAALRQANDILRSESEQRKHVEAVLKRDIAERRKAEAALLESEQRFRLFIQGVTDYAIYLLDPEGLISNWNMGAQRIHQYTAAQIVGQHFSRFYPEEEQQQGEPARALQVAAYEGKYMAEGSRVRRDESVFWASTLIEAIRNEVGTLVGYAVITRDSTERREAEKALGRAQEQLAQSQKMEALGQLTGSIAHDFNNLLMIMSGHAQILRRRLSDPKLLQAVEAIHSAASRGESLTRQLLAFSRRQPLSPVVVDMKQRIEAVRDMLVGSLRGNIELKCDIPDNIWPVEVDIAELELALVNIAVNARDAMPGGGTITLSARNVTLKKSDGVDQLEGDFIALAMSDSGVGIAPDVLAKIFEPFFTTKPLGKGTGLGLAQVYGFSRQSGGTVVAKSAVGSGTTLTVYLPRSHAGVSRSAEAAPAPPVAAGHGTVLIVEDNREVAEVTASLVEQLGFRTLRAENATDALRQLQGGEKIRLVFSDIVMPGSMNGIALAQEISNRYPDIPVLLTSAYSDVAQAAEERFTIVRKPFQLPALDRAIHELLGRRGTPDNVARVLQFSPGRGTSG